MTPNTASALTRNLMITIGITAWFLIGAALDFRHFVAAFKRTDPSPKDSSP
ncbi:MAG: hypothetical protein AAGI68_00500 [Planctomycetota bacterium]